MTGSKINKYEDLNIWSTSHEWTKQIFAITKNLPKTELYGITSQIRRAAMSVPANIVEGYYRNTTKEFIKFLYISRGSAGEVTYFLFLTKELNYISIEEYNEIRFEYEKLIRSISALIKSLSKNKQQHANH